MRVAAILALMTVASGVMASEVMTFRTASVESFLAGEHDGVSIDAAGTLSLGRRVERLAELEEPFLYSAAIYRDGDRDGFVVGTGNQGKVLRIAADGTVTELFRTAEPEVFAVWVDRDGAVLAGSSPQGKVYRFHDGKTEVLFEPGERYIWALARDTGGGLLVATGTEGKLFRVAADGASRVFYDARDPHVRTLLPVAAGAVLVGTAGDGLVLRIEADGAVRTLYDAAQPEITSLALGDAGEVYAAALASEASFVDLTATAKTTTSATTGTPATANGKTDSGSVTVSVQDGTVAAGSRPAGHKGARSEVVAISMSGAADVLWSFDKETVFALLYQQGLWVATGMDGRLYRWRDGQMVLEKDVDETQVVAMLGGKSGPVLATTNSAALYRTATGLEPKGVYTSKVLDAGSVSRFGTLSWQGRDPSGSRVGFQLRSGLSAEPDATWSEWSAGREGREVALDDVRAGRYLQWRAELTAGDQASPELVAVDISYLQSNREPRIKKVEVLAPGEVLVAANFNPSNQAFEPAHPNRDGIFTTLGKPAESGDGARRKKLWKLGYRTLEWEAEDPNGDNLEYALSFRRVDGPERWLEIAKELSDTQYGFDATVLPDGLYRFRLVASDQPSNPEGEARTGEKLTEVVTIDHSPPTLVAAERRGQQLEARVSDTWSPLREAVYSVDAKAWRPVEPVDGLVDGRTETLRLAVPEGATLVLLRLTDAASNVTTFDLSAQAGAAPNRVQATRAQENRGPR